MKTRIVAIILSVAISPALCQPAGWAQTNSNPSADELIQLLDPSSQAAGPQLRGIRRSETPAAVAPSSAPAPTSAASPPRQAAPTSGGTADDGPSASLNVLFATGSADIGPQAAAILNELGKALVSQALAGYRFRIEGHTDTVGSAASNQALSERRAAAVAAWLEAKFGIDARRLTAVGLGSTHLLVQTPDQTAEPRNRRVQVVNLGA